MLPANNGKYTKEERIFFVVLYLRHNADYATIMNEFQEHFPNHPVLARQTILRAYKFLTTGSQAYGSVADAP